MFKVKLTAKAKKELRDLSKFDKLRIAEIIEDLKDDPSSGKPLFRELIKRYSYKVGAYKVIYKINHQDKTVEVLSAGHRANIYK